MLHFVLELCACLVLCFGESQTAMKDKRDATDSNLDISESTGNFSLELLYYAKEMQGTQNLVVSPIATWIVLAAMAEVAQRETRKELVRGLRIYTNRTAFRQELQETTRWLLVNTNTVKLAKLNVIILDKSRLLNRDFRERAKTVYDTEVIELDYANITRNKGNISKFVDESNLNDEQMFLASSLYFKGLWTSSFNTSYTTRQNFYDSSGVKIGRVNMMYNRYTYPFVRLPEIQAKVIELPYGVENRLSMLIMLPNPSVTIENMFLNFRKVLLDTIFHKLKLSQENGDVEVDCYIPRFKIESNLELSEILKKGMGIFDLFDAAHADVRHMVRRIPAYVRKVIHKAEMEVTEEGTTASGFASESANGKVKMFQANRPFSYLIIEKVTNTIIFGGVYQQPSLYEY